MLQNRNSVDADYAAPEEKRDIEESFGRRPIARSQTASEALVSSRSGITVILSPPSRQLVRHGSPE